MMTKQITIWISEELLERVRVYAKNKTGSSKALSGTINKIMEEYLSKDQKEDPPTHSDSTHTHETHEAKKGIEDIMEWIGKNSPTGITRKQIEKLIQEYKGMDSRTIRKYEPLIISQLLEDGFKQHPANQELLIKYNL
jgi:hypothetical protein